MSIDFATLVSLCADAALVIFGAALALMVIVQDVHRRSNQYFALCMAIFTLYGAGNMAMAVPQQYDLDPKPLLYGLTTLYIGGIILLFNFVLSFAGLPRSFRVKERLVSVPVGTLAIALVWSGRIFRDFEPLSAGGYSYRLTPLGVAGAAVAMVYLLSIIAVLYRQRSAQTRELALPVAIIVLGLVGFTSIPTLRRYSFNAAALTVAGVMLGHLVLKYRIFQPLADLNAELALKNAELIEATQLKSQFLANMSHELRTPLNSIIGYAELVVAGTYGDLTDLQQDRLQKVMRNGHILLELINDVLDLSKIEAGRLALALTRVPTGGMLDDLLKEFEPKATEKGLALVRGYGKLPAMQVDAGRARQILSNLLSNAIKFTDQGVVIVRAHYDPAHHQVVISITDTGPGIDPAQQERIFEAFPNVESVIARQHEGTGLGLAIARRLSEMHNGNLWFESVVGQGSTFHVALPADDEAPAPVSIITPRRRSSGPVVLVIDDDHESIEVLQGHLESARYRVYGALNANEGLKLAHELHPALITLDIRMPDMDGWQLLQALRRDPVTAATPVLVVSATDEPAGRALPDMSGYITKPIQPDALLDHVRRLLSAHALDTPAEESHP